ncbi:MAG: regulator of sigma E protease [Candidatus Omnitrophota bacterium]|jgi:regulator of sigma E protease
MLDGLLSNLSGTLVFIVVLGILVLVHEWGHFITAKKCGVEVKEFAIGFGPTLWSKEHNGTNYLLKLYPLGGYVKMAGDERDKCTGDSKEFYAQSLGKRALIVLNGPVVNFIFAYLCFVIVFMVGYPDLSTRVGELTPKYPAAIAGLLEGDDIKTIDGVAIESWTDIQSNITESKNDKITIVLQREGSLQTLYIEPKIDKSANIFGQMKERRIVGIGPARDLIALKYDFMTSVVKAGEKLTEITTMTYKSLWYMVTGSMSTKENLTGPVGIFMIVKSAAELGIGHLLFIMGVISASLAIFNLLPIIPLDGGHLFLMGIEKIKGSALSPKVDEYIARFGFSLIILLALFVFYNDFARFGVFERIRAIFP